MHYLAYVVLFMTYLGLGYLPGYRMNRAAIALTGAALLIVLGVINLQTAWTALDPNTLAFLFGVMVLNAHLGYAGFFQLILGRLVHLAKTPLGLLIWLTLTTGLLSAFFLNDTIAILFTPLVLGMTGALNLPPIPYLLALAGSSNLGSVATLTGNPQNILVGWFSHLPFLDFALTLTPVALASLTVQVGLLLLLYPSLRSTQPLPSLPPMRFRVNRALLFKGVWVTAALLLAFLLNYPLAQAALVAAGILLWSRRLRSERFFHRVDWELLVMFSGLFMVTAAVKALGLLVLLQPLAAFPWGLAWVSVVLSNLISNVPAVLLLHPIIAQGDTQGWLLLASASTLAGNLTLLGSVANLIVAETARRMGYKLSFLEHLQFGLPLTLITLLLSYVWIYG